MIASEQLGIEASKVRLNYRDTDEVPIGGSAFGSKSLQSAGVAVHREALQLVEQGWKLAANMAESSIEGLIFDAERGVHVKGTPAVAVEWSGLAAHVHSGGNRHVRRKQADIETWHVWIEKLITCDDAGIVISPPIAKRQVHGGLSKGIAQALYEELRYEEDGNTLTSTLADYLIVSACESFFDGTFQQTPTDRIELGMKGIGEPGCIGSTPAVVDAVIDALSDFGIRRIDMLKSPKRVWRSLKFTPTDLGGGSRNGLRGRETLGKLLGQSVYLLRQVVDLLRQRSVGSQ